MDKIAALFYYTGNRSITKTMPKSNNSSNSSNLDCPPFMPPKEEKTPLIDTLAAAGNQIDCQNVSTQAISLPVITELPVAKPLSRAQIDHLLIYLARTIFLGLLSYELLNVLGVIHHPINFTWRGLFFTNVFCWLIFEIILSYTKKSLGKTIPGVLMLAASAGIFADAWGDMHFLFDKIQWYDQVMHFFAGGVVAGAIIFWFLKSLQDNGKIRVGLPGIGFFAWMITVFFGVLYELGEYGEDIFTGSHRLGDGIDTANDLMHNTLGALFIISLLIVYFYYDARHRNRAADKTA